MEPISSKSNFFFLIGILFFQVPCWAGLSLESRESLRIWTVNSPREISWSPPIFDYDVEKAKKVGPYSFDETNLYFRLTTGSKPKLIYKYPQGLFRQPQLELVNSSGHKRSGAESELVELAAQESGPWRLCLVENIIDEQTHSFQRFCSPELELVQQKLVFFSKPSVPRVLINGQSQSLSGRVILNNQDFVRASLRFADGSLYEFSTQISAPEIQTSYLDNGLIVIEGFGVAPVGSVALLSSHREPGWISQKLQWLDTIKDERRHWQLQKNFSQNGVIYFLGLGGGVFGLEYQAGELPQKAQLAKLAKEQRYFSYLAKIPLHLVQGDQQDVRNLEGLNTPGFHEGRFSFAGRDYQTRLEKAFPGEASTRITGLAASSGSLVVLGELSFNYWFSSFLGGKSNFWSDRWGVYGRGLRSLQTLEAEGSSAMLIANSLDLKYRFTPGLWGRHETWGAQFGVSELRLSHFACQFLGLVIFWGRSMPLVFDKFFNLIPFLNYPKWVDLEIIYYPVSYPSSEIKVLNTPDGIGNWTMNFHGKIFWTPRFFGEGGFGLRQYDFIQKRRVQEQLEDARLTLAFLYATIGFGWSF